MEWSVTTLGNVCEFENGDRGKNYPSRAKFVDSGIAFINAGHIDDGVIDFSTMNYISEETFSALSRGKAQSGDVLFCLRGSLGKFGIVDKDTQGAIASSLVIIRPKNLSADFLAYYLRSSLCQKEVEKYAAGAAQPNLGAKDLSKFEILIPPIPEQKRIVAILDQAFAHIEQARAKTEQNLKNARELFESYLQKVFSQRGEGWTETNLGTVAEFKNGLNFSQSSKGEKLKVVGVKDFKSNFMVPFEQLDTIQIDGDLSESYELKENDIITVRSNGNKRLIGRCLLMGEVSNKISYSGFTIRIRLVDKSVFPKFLAYYLKSSSTHELLINSGEGANISNLNQKILTSLPIVFPSYDQQELLVENIKQVEFEAKKLERVYTSKLNSIDELKKSILQKAFSGELTKTPDGDTNKGAAA